MRPFLLAAVILISASTFAADQKKSLGVIAQQYIKCAPPEAVSSHTEDISRADLRRKLKVGEEIKPVYIEEGYQVQWSMSPTFLVPRPISPFAIMTLERSSEGRRIQV